MLLEVLAEDSVQPLTQGSGSLMNISIDHSAEISLATILASNDSKGSLGTKNKEKPRFAEFVISHYAVARFVKACIDKVFPIELLGGLSNIKTIGKGVFYQTQRS